MPPTWKHVGIRCDTHHIRRDRTLHKKSACTRAIAPHLTHATMFFADRINCRLRGKTADPTATPIVWFISKCYWTTVRVEVGAHLSISCLTVQLYHAVTRSTQQEPTRNTAVRVLPATSVRNITLLAVTHSRIRMGSPSTRFIHTQSGPYTVSFTRPPK